MVEGFKAEVYLSLKPFDKPSFKPAHTGLYGCFILWFKNPGRDDGDAIMSCKFPICVVDFRVIEIRMDNRSLTVVGNKDPRAPAIPLKGIYMTLVPEQLCFIRECLNKGI